jgi:hypothetical protein
VTILDEALAKGETYTFSQIGWISALRSKMKAADVRDVSSATGIAPTTLYLFKRGATYSPSADIVDRLARYFYPGHALTLVPVDHPVVDALTGATIPELPLDGWTVHPHDSNYVYKGQEVILMSELKRRLAAQGGEASLADATESA